MHNNGIENTKLVYLEQDILSYLTHVFQAKIFTGNSDRNTVVENSFSPTIFTRFVRVHPITAKEQPAIRVGFKGCTMGE